MFITLSRIDLSHLRVEGHKYQQIPPEFLE